ncbi:Ribonuclease P protein component [bacterium HR39]|nr:Ribonuclease P protein component [bacterium HR39]
MSGGAPRVRLERLRRRQQFLAAARGAKVHMPVLVVQCVPRPGGDAEPTIGVGFTASRKVGNAVARNRARRRLREAARRVLPEVGEPGCDYVLIARQAVVTCPFAELERQLAEAVRRLRAGCREKASAPERPPAS